MPINELIALQSRVPDVGQTIGNALTNVGTLQQIRENQQTSSARKQLALTEADLARVKSNAIISSQIIPMLEQNDIEGTRATLTARRDQMKKLGLDPSDMDDALIELDRDPQRLLAGANGWIQRASMFDKSGKPAGLVEFEEMTKGLKPDEKEKARKIALGLDARAVGSAASTIAETGKTDLVAGSEAKISGAKAGASESAELDAQLEKLPGVKAAVTAAEERIKLEVEAEGVKKKNAIALETYDTAMKGLLEALAGTETGPGVGRLPAVTAEQQIAEGAIAAIAPTLKSIFRIAGEGNFTDSDQKLLLDMIPTRKDHPAAVKSKVRNIDAIIRAKLGTGAVASAAPQQNNDIDALVNKYAP